MKSLEITHSLEFPVNTIAQYIVVVGKLEKVTIKIQGRYNPPHFKGSFEGYSTATLKISKVWLMGKRIKPTHKLYEFLTDEFFDAISPSFNNTEDEHICP